MYFSRQIYSCGFHIFKFNNFKVIHDLYSQCLTQALSKTTSVFSMEGVQQKANSDATYIWMIWMENE